MSVIDGDDTSRLNAVPVPSRTQLSPRSVEYQYSMLPRPCE